MLWRNVYLASVLRRSSACAYAVPPPLPPPEPSAAAPPPPAAAARQWYFKHANVRAFLEAEPALRAALRLGPVAPVCYGGTFAAARDRILDVPEKAWAALERALTRGDNIEEGSFVERLWAPLLAARPSADFAKAVACAAARTVRPPRSYAGMLRRCDCKRTC